MFKPHIGKEILEIPEKENLRFSHQIPSFSLAKEKGMKFSDLYELESASVPDVFLQKEWRITTQISAVQTPDLSEFTQI